MDQKNCCSNDSCDVSASQPTSLAGVCPHSGSRGKRVDGATVKAMLAVSLTQVRDTTYFFCQDADCPVVYFSEDGTQTFTTEHVREHVYQKEPESDDVLVCYCFRHTLGSIRAECLSSEESTVINAINAGIQAGQCACDIRNPQGVCCLGNVRSIVKALGPQASTSKD